VVQIYNFEEVSPLGILLVRTIESLRGSGCAYSFDEIIEKILQDTRSDPASKGAAENYLRAVDSWGLFSKEGTSLSELVSGGKTTILDVSTLENENVSAAAVSILAGKLYEERLEARRAYEKRLMGEKTDGKEFPMVWLFIDEAHIFVPAKTESLASGVLINRCLRQGRQPGLSRSWQPRDLQVFIPMSFPRAICLSATVLLQMMIFWLWKLPVLYICRKVSSLFKEDGERKRSCFDS
jgi:hypothetical protein